MLAEMPIVELKSWQSSICRTGRILNVDEEEEFDDDQEIEHGDGLGGADDFDEEDFDDDFDDDFEEDTEEYESTEDDAPVVPLNDDDDAELDEEFDDE